MSFRTPEEEKLYQHYFRAIEQIVLSPKPTLTELTSSSDPIGSNYNDNNKNLNNGISKSQGQDVLVLDSSFNPPHAAHALLLQRSLAHLLSRAAVGPAALGSHRPATTAIKAVLLFATANADKAVAAASVPALVAAYAERAMLMRKFLDQQPQSQNQATPNPANATTTTTTTGVDFSIAVCNCSKFVEKAHLFTQSRLQPTHHHNNDNNSSPRQLLPRHGNLIFAVGFDTIVRVFAPRYYADIPGGINAALGQAPFRFVVMTRDASSYPGTNNNNNNKNNNDTDKTQQQPQTGELEPNADFFAQKQQLQDQLTDLGLWDYWQPRVDWVRGDASSFGVSSSRIRQQVGQLGVSTNDSLDDNGTGDNTGGNRLTAEQMCGPLVYDYILRAGLYRASH
jgi:hypothetical protein